MSKQIKGRYIDPFVGGASIFFYLKPTRSLLSDVNSELMELYRTLRSFPHETWEKYRSMPETKEGYYTVRSLDPMMLELTLTFSSCTPGSSTLATNSSSFSTTLIAGAQCHLTLLLNIMKIAVRRRLRNNISNSEVQSYF